MSRRYEPACFTTSDKKVYHRIGEVTSTPDATIWRFGTACGKRIDQLWGINSIDRPRAELLGRPCGKCYPVSPVEAKP